MAWTGGPNPEVVAGRIQELRILRKTTLSELDLVVVNRFLFLKDSNAEAWLRPTLPDETAAPPPAKNPAPDASSLRPLADPSSDPGP